MTAVYDYTPVQRAAVMLARLLADWADRAAARRCAARPHSPGGVRYAHRHSGLHHAERQREAVQRDWALNPRQH